MNILTPLSTIGRVTADLELKSSQNGNNTPYVSFSLAVDKGFRDKGHTVFLQCVLYDEKAERMIKANVKKGSLIYIVGNLDITEYTRADQSKDHAPKVTLYDWCFAPTSKAKPSDNDNASESQDGFLDVPAAAGENGLPFN